MIGICPTCGGELTGFARRGELFAVEDPPRVTWRDKVLEVRPGSGRIMFSLVRSGSISITTILEYSSAPPERFNLAMVQISQLRSALKEASVPATISRLRDGQYWLEWDGEAPRLEWGWRTKTY